MNRIYLATATALLLARTSVSFTSPRHNYYAKTEIIIEPTVLVSFPPSAGHPNPNTNQYRSPHHQTFFRNKDTIQRCATSQSVHLEPPSDTQPNAQDGNISPKITVDSDQNPPQTLQPQPPLPENAAKSLDGRLICASQCAYNLTQPYFQSAGYRHDTVAKRISRGVNSVLIGMTHDGITIAFRGTQTSNPLDWIQNAALYLTPVGDRTGFKGKMHAGFYRSTKSLWKPLKEVLMDMLRISEEKGWKKDVYFTGHSRGGAMASVAALLMKRDGDFPDPTYVCTFGSAKVGDSEFRDYFNKKISQTSYEAHLDIIPFLPPSASTMGNMNDELSEIINGMLWSEKSSNKKHNYKWNYQTVGKRKFIDESAKISDEDVTKELDSRRIRDIEKGTFLSLADFRAAHCSSCADEGCSGYYFKAVADVSCGICEDNE